MRRLLPLTILALAAAAFLISMAACKQKETATPTPTLPPGWTIYRNTDLGFSIAFPQEWVETETGIQEPAVVIQGPGNLPVVQVIISPLPQVMTASEFADLALEALKQGLTNFQELSRQDVTLGTAPGFAVTFTGASQNTELKAKIIFVLRGSQVLQVLAYSTTANYDRMQSTIDSVASSFRMEEPAALAGIPRSQALTLAGAGPVTLDPVLSRDSNSASFIVEIFSGLVSLNRNLAVVPELASSWDVSDDGKTYTFHLRKKAKFHSGREVTAEDFKYSIERAADPQTGSETAALHLGDIVGVKDKLAGTATEVSGVRVVDPYTLEITIDAPKPYFLKKLTHTVAMVVDRNNVETGGEWWRQPNSTGPFKLKEWVKDDTLILERNPDYYLGAPKLPYVVFRLFAGIPMLMYESGEIDITSVGLEDLERVQDPANPLNKELITSPGFTLYYIGFNQTVPPFDDPKVRLAFSYATDKQKLLDLVLKGAVRPASGILPPSFPGYNPQVKGLDFDLAKAKALLAQSKYAVNGQFPPLVFTTASFGTDPGPIVSALVDMWQQNLGVTFDNVRIMNPDDYTYKLREEKDNLFDMGWIADYPDPENFLDILFYSGSAENIGEYSNPEVDDLLERARAEQDEASRMELYRQVEQKLVDDAAILPIFFDINYVLLKPYVKGYAPTPMPIPTFKYISLEH
ncbi:MAG: DcrB-related protein [Chloroflexi bacterium]|nr:DcrB-related protein [Chloroflexota bacterium]